MNCGDMRKSIYKSKNKTRCLEEKGIDQENFTDFVKEKDNKIEYKQSGAIEAAMIGKMLLGIFLANYDDFKNSDMKGKIHILGYSSIRLGFLLVKKLINITPVMQKVPVGSLFKYGLFAFSIFEMGRGLYEVVFSKS